MYNESGISQASTKMRSAKCEKKKNIKFPIKLIKYINIQEKPNNNVKVFSSQKYYNLDFNKFV